MTDDERLQQLNQQISKLQGERKALIKASDQKFLEEAKVNIGRCFFNAATNTYAKVIDVPQVIETMLGSKLNRYQYPAVFIGKDPDFDHQKSPIYEDNLFSGAWGVGYNPLETWEEISPSAFDVKLKQALDDFLDYVINVKSINRETSPARRRNKNRHNGGRSNGGNHDSENN